MHARPAGRARAPLVPHPQPPRLWPAGAIRVRAWVLTGVRTPIALVLLAGFRVSRSKMGDLIKGGDVRVNWRPAAKPSVELKQGDVVSCSGACKVLLLHGRLCVPRA